jgi:2-desacetyl-2-hydroxyethyl bacteriochlorophyllide A dehydrogenase
VKRLALVFRAPQRVELEEEELRPPAEGQVLVRTLLSGISPGTEMLFYRGLVPENMPLDATIPAFAGELAGYPFKYGYSCVGEVVELGRGVEQGWLGRRIFSFHPHESYFTAGLDELVCIPPAVCDDGAVFLPNMETAVNLVMDGQPLIGEAVAVFGLGVIGLLTCALLAQHPLGALVGFDRYALRRAEGLRLGMQACLDPADPAAPSVAYSHFASGVEGTDLAFELSGNPAALNQAIELAAFDSRIVIGSWYGKRPASLDLGGKFHRSRIRLIGSQVSTLAPALSGRWSKARRLDVAWAQLQRVKPEKWITQRLPIGQAPEAYRLLAERPESAIQVIFEY